LLLYLTHGKAHPVQASITCPDTRTTLSIVT
jgi:hypothetical protein